MSRAVDDMGTIVASRADEDVRSGIPSL